MARLIDAEFIEKWINREEHNTPDERWRPESEFAAMIDNAPTVDAVEVVHAKWKYYHKQNIAVCTNCSFERDLDVSFGKAVSCPNCGAKMDENETLKGE